MGRLFIETKSRPESLTVVSEVAPIIATPSIEVAAPEIVEKIVEVVKTEYVQVPVEVIKEVVKVEYVQVPFEVEKIVERIVEKPVEVIKEVEKVIRIEDMAKIQALKSELADAKRQSKIYAFGMAIMIILTMIMGAGYV